MLCFNHRVDLLRKLLNSDATATVARSDCSLRMSRKLAYVAMPIEALAKTSKCYDVTAAVRTRFVTISDRLHRSPSSLLYLVTSTESLHVYVIEVSPHIASSESSLYVVGVSLHFTSSAETVLLN